MATFLFSFLAILASIGALGVGVALGRSPLRGSCGGLAGVRGLDCGGCKRRKRGEERR